MKTRIAAIFANSSLLLLRSRGFPAGPGPVIVRRTVHLEKIFFLSYLSGRGRKGRDT
jgi:hypothetical protein